jgi:hypothetical protein
MPRRTLPLLLLVPASAWAGGFDTGASPHGNVGTFLGAVVVGIVIAWGFQQLFTWLVVAGGAAGDHHLDDVVVRLGGPPLRPLPPRFDIREPERRPAPARWEAGVGSAVQPEVHGPGFPAERTDNVEPMTLGSVGGGRLMQTSAGEEALLVDEDWDTRPEGHLPVRHVVDPIHPVSGQIYGATGAVAEVPTGSGTRVPVAEVRGRLVGPDGLASSTHPSSGGTPALSRPEPGPEVLDRLGLWAGIGSFLALFAGGWLVGDLTPTENAAVGLLGGLLVWLGVTALTALVWPAARLTLSGTLVHAAVDRRRGRSVSAGVGDPTGWALRNAVAGAVGALLGGLVAALA